MYSRRLELTIPVSLICAPRVGRRFLDVDDDILSLIPVTRGKTTASLFTSLLLITPATKLLKKHAQAGDYY